MGEVHVHLGSKTIDSQVSKFIDICGASYEISILWSDLQPVAIGSSGSVVVKCLHGEIEQHPVALGDISDVLDSLLQKMTEWHPKP